MKRLPDADLSQKNVVRIEVGMPDTVRTEAVDISAEARAIAWLVFGILDRTRAVHAAVEVLAETRRFENGGDLAVDIEKALGLDVAFEVFDGLSAALLDYYDDMRYRSAAVAKASRHALDHYCELGEPILSSES